MKNINIKYTFLLNNLKFIFMLIFLFYIEKEKIRSKYKKIQHKTKIQN